MIIYKCDTCGKPNNYPYNNSVFDNNICEVCKEKINNYMEHIRPYNEIYDILKNTEYDLPNTGCFYSYQNLHFIDEPGGLDTGYMRESNLSLVERICKLLNIKDTYRSTYDNSVKYKDFLYEGLIPTKKLLYEIIIKLNALF